MLEMVWGSDTPILLVVGVRKGGLKKRKKGKGLSKGGTFFRYSIRAKDFLGSNLSWSKKKGKEKGGGEKTGTKAV